MADDEVRHWKSLKKTEAAAVGFRQQVCSQEAPPLGATIRMKRQGFTGTVDLLRGRLQLRVRGDDEALTSGSRYLPSSSKRTRPQLCLCRSQTVECRCSCPKRRVFVVAETPLSWEFGTPAGCRKAICNSRSPFPVPVCCGGLEGLNPIMCCPGRQMRKGSQE